MWTYSRWNKETGGLLLLYWINITVCWNKVKIDEKITNRLFSYYYYYSVYNRWTNRVAVCVETWLSVHIRWNWRHHYVSILTSVLLLSFVPRWTNSFLSQECSHSHSCLVCCPLSGLGHTGSVTGAQSVAVWRVGDSLWLLYHILIYLIVACRDKNDTALIR